MRCVGAVLAALVVGVAPAAAHEVIDPDLISRRMAEVADLRTAIDHAGSLEAAAKANLDLGLRLLDLADLLSAERASHGGDHGVTAAILIEELAAMGLELEYAAGDRRYRTVVAPFERAIAAAPDSIHAAIARYHLITAWFYEQTPKLIRPDAQVDPVALRYWADQAADFVARHPTFEPLSRREEMTFIAGALAHRAYQGAPSTASGDRATRLLRSFAADYPQSMRIAAVRLMLDELESRRAPSASD